MTSRQSSKFDPARNVSAATLLAGLLIAGLSQAAVAACSSVSPVKGLVSVALDGRTLRLQDGQEVRLAGVEIASSGEDAGAAASQSALAVLTERREVALHAAAKPDRYGRIVAFVFVEDAIEPIQGALLAQGRLIVAGSTVERECATYLARRENDARQAKTGVWAAPAAIKNAEMPGDILARMGQFVVVEGKVLSVREAGATLYMNFGRRWTRDLAVTISRRAVRGFETAGIAPKSLENRIVRVRGFVEQRGGPRIQAFGPGQIEVVGGK